MDIIPQIKYLRHDDKAFTAKVRKVPAWTGAKTKNGSSEIIFIPQMEKLIGKKIEVYRASDKNLRDFYQMVDIKNRVQPLYNYKFHKSWLEFFGETPPDGEEGDQIELPLFEATNGFPELITAKVKANLKAGMYQGVVGVTNDMAAHAGKPIKVMKYDIHSYSDNNGSYDKWYLGATSNSPGARKWYWHESWLDFHEEGEQIEMPLFEEAYLEWGPVVKAKVKQVKLGTQIKFNNSKSWVTFTGKMDEYIGRTIKVRQNLTYKDLYRVEQDDVLKNDDFQYWFHKDWLDFHEEGDQIELPLFESANRNPYIYVTVKKKIVPLEHGLLFVPGMEKYKGKKIQVRQVAPGYGYGTDYYEIKDDVGIDRINPEYKWKFHKSWLDFHEEGDQIELPLFESYKPKGDKMSGKLFMETMQSKLNTDQEKTAIENMKFRKFPESVIKTVIKLNRYQKFDGNVATEGNLAAAILCTELGMGKMNKETGEFIPAGKKAAITDDKIISAIDMLVEFVYPNGADTDELEKIISGELSPQQKELPLVEMKTAIVEKTDLLTNGKYDIKINYYNTGRIIVKISDSYTGKQLGDRKIFDDSRKATTYITNIKDWLTRTKENKNE